MANASYKRNGNAPGSDYLSFLDGSTQIKLRVRHGEVVEVDLVDTAQDAAFDQSQYTATGTAPYSHKLKPSA
jgi:hypothetical protein